MKKFSLVLMTIIMVAIVSCQKEAENLVGKMNISSQSAVSATTPGGPILTVLVYKGTRKGGGNGSPCGGKSWCVIINLLAAEATSEGQVLANVLNETYPAVSNNNDSYLAHFNLTAEGRLAVSVSLAHISPAVLAEVFGDGYFHAEDFPLSKEMSEQLGSATMLSVKAGNYPVVIDKQNITFVINTEQSVIK